MGPDPAAVAPAVGGVLRAERGAAGPPGRRSATASTRRCGWPRTSTWSGGWPAPGGGCATSRRPRSPTTTPSGRRQWLRRRAFYGTGAALLAARHGERGRARSCSRRSPRLAWALARRRRTAGPRGGGGAARRDRRPAGPPAGPPGRAPAAGVRRAGWSSAGRPPRGGRWPGRSPGTTGRWRWPPRRSRAGRGAAVLAVAAADAVAAWWPHRHRVGPVRFAAARRLEDLAYGAGLWWGALRARGPARAAARAPAAAWPEHTVERNDRPVPRLVALCTAVRASVGPRENSDARGAP